MENTDHDSPESTSQEKVKKSRGIPILFFLLVIVAGGSAAASFWGWQQLTAIKNEQFRVVTLQESGQKEQQSNKQAFTEQLNSLAPLPGAYQKLNQKILRLEKAVAEGINRGDKLAAQMAKFTNHDEVDWQIAQLEYYTLLANKRLKLTHDLSGAIALLDESIGIAKDIDEPQALTIMRALESDKAMLSTVVDENVEHVYIKIHELIRRIDQLAMPALSWTAINQSLPGKDPVTDAGPKLKYFSDIEGWAAYLDLAIERASSALTSFVRIQTLDKPIKPLLPPEQRIYLQQNLQLMFEQAQLSAMRRQGGNFRASLAQAQRWLGDYFREDTEVARYMNTTVAELLELKIDSPIPEISGSIEVVKSFSTQWPNIKQKRQGRTKNAEPAEAVEMDSEGRGRSFPDAELSDPGLPEPTSIGAESA